MQDPGFPDREVMIFHLSHGRDAQWKVEHMRREVERRGLARKTRRDEINRKRRERYAKTPTWKRDYDKTRGLKYRHDALSILTNGDIKCQNNGVNVESLLEIHHKNGDGKLHRKDGIRMDRWVIRNPIEAKERCMVICANCHRFEQKNGRFPTKEEYNCGG